MPKKSVSWNAPLPGDRDHGNRIHEGIGQGGDEIGRAGAAGGHAHAHLAGGAGVTGGHETAALFVAREDGADFFRLRQRLVEELAGAAGIGENRIDALMFQARDQDLGTVHGVAAAGGGGQGRLFLPGGG
jgi:hypothetical protein